MTRTTIRAFTCLLTLPAVSLLFGFTDTGPEQQKVLMAEMPLYLEEHLDAARIEGSEVPEDLPEPVEWRFDEPQPDWRPAKPIPAELEAVKPVRVDDALRMPLTAENRADGLRLVGIIYVELPDWKLEDWTYVEIRARTRDPMRVVGLAFNYTEKDEEVFPFYTPGDRTPLVTDGTVQTYRLSLDHPYMRRWEGPWTHLGIFFNSQDNEEAVTLDILSVSVIPREVPYDDAPVGVRYEVRDRKHKRTIFTHTPGRLEYRLRAPQAGRLDVGLGVLKKDVPVTFRITATPQGGDVITLLDETYSDHEHWAQRCVDLSALSGKRITLSLEADAERAGTVAFWAAPTISGTRKAERPIANTLIWDTQSAFMDQVDVRDRANWKVVVDPPAQGEWGREYSFQGDVVVENEHLAVVFWSRKGRVVIYSKTDLSKKRVEFAPLQLKGKPASITNCRILQNTGDEAAVEISFSAKETEYNLSAVFSFGKKQIVDIKPSENMKGISLLSPIEYGVIPDFVGDDLIFDPRKYPSMTTLQIPSGNLFLGLLKGQNNMLVVTWPKGKQQMRLVLDNEQREPRLIESIDFDNDGKSIYLALLDAPGIWHKEELKPSYLEKDVAINWKRPFPAKWMTQLHEDGVKTTYRFKESKGPVYRVIGRYIYPVWFKGETAFYRLGKKILPKGESLIYFLERKGTPVSVSTPVDIMKETLGRQACDTILDIPGRRLRTHHRRPGETILDACTCDFTQKVLQPVFEAGQEVEKKNLVEETVDDMVFFVTQHGERIDEYQDFAHDMMSFLKLKRKSNPDLKPFFDSMETITQEILQEYSRLKENIKTLDYADELARKTKALTQKKDPQNLPAYLDLGEKWRGMGGAQDELVGKLHSVTRQLFQEAGYSCVNQPQTVEIVEEIRRRCRKCLRNPDGFEIWPDY
ncbi:MAG: hypothetical protein CEE38_15515 [Planctomycetes bacterium B3_Pla]|nr:MAG: hypothetical protein CEE38_15515 [Planctomycetes bacterium B3_Pla]